MSKNTPLHTRVLIIGAGPAGYTAAVYAARANLAPILIQGIQPGGQLMITTDVENYPGFSSIQGPELMEKMEKQAALFGTKLVSDTVTNIDFSQYPFRAEGDSGSVYLADSVIIATGAKARWLGLPSEQKYMGKGVSACATCDGFFFRGKKVAVVGGGNSAVEEALFLANLCDSVTLVHRRDSLRAEKIMQDRLFANSKIKVIWDTVVKEVIGTDNGMTGLCLEDVKTGKETSLDVEGCFVAIGHDPATAVFRGKLDMDTEGYIKTKPDSTETSVPGVYAAGDVKDKIFRQAVTAAGMGCMAALEADKFLAARPAVGNNNKAPSGNQGTVKKHGLG